MTQTKKETAAADPHLIPTGTKKTFLRGKAFSINIILENNHPIKPIMRMTDQISCIIKILFPQQSRKNGAQTKLPNQRYGFTDYFARHL